ncbi:TerB family tellurite resistance protein [Thiocapsa bogorovii]|uniref:TerB family tellurite resistance protein n=1 Tax=Thiocapsa bogorovii TaxID=521689 RepID=UPI001E5C925D|nr:TerB family tellurite resistance protein [Thiocapsa bogorovii]UHD14730.1 TerB family tellurite resistance protein [Thiocapsa bogorovii]
MPEITPYADNSAEAMLRVISLFIISDGEVQDEEMEMLEQLGVFERFGVDRDEFARIFDGYCDDLIAHAGTARFVGLADPDWVDTILEPVTDRIARRTLARMLLLLARSDGFFADAELAIYRQMLDRWEIDIDSLAEPD